jgi:hypothetical protein
MQSKKIAKGSKSPTRSRSITRSKSPSGRRDTQSRGNHAYRRFLDWYTTNMPNTTYTHESKFGKFIHEYVHHITGITKPDATAVMKAIRSNIKDYNEDMKAQGPVPLFPSWSALTYSSDKKRLTMGFYTKSNNHGFSDAYHGFVIDSLKSLGLQVRGKHATFDARGEPSEKIQNFIDGGNPKERDNLSPNKNYMEHNLTRIALTKLHPKNLVVNKTSETTLRRRPSR